MLKEIYSFTELFQKMSREHQSKFYYRGQIRDFGPLFPSMYRPLKTIGPFRFAPGTGIRKDSGHQYYFRSRFIHDNYDQDYCECRNKKRVFMAYTRNALGYCLSEAFFQQAGWSSEGLDVTSDINVAFYFATHKYCNGVYQRLSSDSDDLHILYRWTKIPEEKWDSIGELNRRDFYNRPVLFPTLQVMTLFPQCHSLLEFEESVAAYRHEIKWDPISFDLDSLMGNRPFHLLRIPTFVTNNSRIANQYASLIFPRSFRIRPDIQEYLLTYFDDENIHNANVFFNSGGSLIEDLSGAYGCEKYYFHMNRRDYDFIRDIKYEIEDFSHKMVYDWQRSFFANGFGTQFIAFPGDNSGLAQLDCSYNFSEMRYKNLELDFNG